MVSAGGLRTRKVPAYGAATRCKCSGATSSCTVNLSVPERNLYEIAFAGKLAVLPTWNDDKSRSERRGPGQPSALIKGPAAFASPSGFLCNTAACNSGFLGHGPESKTLESGQGSPIPRELIDT